MLKEEKLKAIDINYNTILSTDLEPKFFDEEKQEMISYWTDSKRVYWKVNIIKGADIETFKVYNSIFAKDKKNSYLNGKALKGANATSFVALNNCYAKDDRFVWTIGGVIKDVDAETFEVCDEGIQKPSCLSKIEFRDGTVQDSYLRIPYGFAKDKNKVFYENYQGKTKVLKKADPQTFRSFNNGYFAYDDKQVFYGKDIIQKANVKTWSIIDFDKNIGYSKDDKHIFYGSKIIKNADKDIFELYKAIGRDGYVEYFGKDKNSFYHRTEPITIEEIDTIVNEIC